MVFVLIFMLKRFFMYSSYGQAWCVTAFVFASVSKTVLMFTDTLVCNWGGSRPEAHLSPDLATKADIVGGKTLEKGSIGREGRKIRGRGEQGGREKEERRNAREGGRN